MVNKHFCHECFAHICRANSIFTTCEQARCAADQYEEIGVHFSVLASAARSSRMQVLASYAQAMAGFARNLISKPAAQIDNTDMTLLQSGIEAGLPCHEGKDFDQCPNQNFDRVWPLIAELRAHSTHD